MHSRYNFENFKLAIRNPNLFVEESERLLSKKIFERKNGSGVDIMNEDWDNLLILDACRYDKFSDHCDMEGKHNTVISKGNDSRSFIDKNFADRELHDTIYITANPFVERLSDDVFYKVVYKEVFEHWDKELKTIPPSAIVEKTIEIHNEYPNKRLISHFMQPHAPYIGKKGKQMSSERKFGKFNPQIEEKGDYNIPTANIPDAINENIISENELIELYNENLDIVLEYAKKLVNNLDGKSVITSDHGELLGDKLFGRKRYGHSRYHMSELRRVPWFIPTFNGRREIEEGVPKSFDRLNDRKQHLQALGYMN
jgi:hypothetical protein